MAVVQEANNQVQDQDTFDYICDSCEKLAKLRYHCTVCYDFDLCFACFDKHGHEHEMEKYDSASQDGSVGEGQKQINPILIKMLCIRRFFRYFSHATSCKKVPCNFPSCQGIKRLLLHSKKCKQRNNQGCPICDKFVTLCCYHAKYCQDVSCRVPFCTDIRSKLRLQELFETSQREALIRHRMAAMENNLAANNMLQPRLQQLSQAQIIKRHVASLRKVIQNRGI